MITETCAPRRRARGDVLVVSGALSEARDVEQDGGSGVVGRGLLSPLTAVRRAARRSNATDRTRTTPTAYTTASASSPRTTASSCGSDRHVVPQRDR